MATCKQNIHGNSPKVTTGDPRNYDTEKSDRTTNQQDKPAMPCKNSLPT
ncbi:hypothetical protein [Lucifera butyrica]|nr:hypothetical protein [Lucifera butyrica]